jgi:prepilin-type processing-associated H-X9-DG protein
LTLQGIQSNAAVAGALKRQATSIALSARAGTRGLRLFGLLWMTFACLAAPVAPTVVAQAQEANDLEKRVKAAYILKFADYVEWPATMSAQADAPITFGVLGDEQIAAELAQTAAGRASAGHPLVARRLKEGEALTGVNILFAGGKDAAHLAQVLKAVAAQPVLIVTEADGALERGSAINFVLVDGHVKFEIALDNAEKRGIKLSSRLLAVARKVVTAGGQPQ